MKVVIIGGTGLIGARTVRILRDAGHEATMASADTVTGAGLAEALAGAQVVVDLADAPSVEDQAALEDFEASGRTLLAAEAAAGVGHHVALSMVGAERPGCATQAQEQRIRASGIPYTIVHSTQLFEFLRGIARSAAADGTIRLPPVAVQPIASDDVAAFLARVALGAPVNDTIEIAGPEPACLSHLVARYLKAKDDPRVVVSDPRACGFGAPDDRPPAPGSTPRLGMLCFEAWFHQARARA